MSDKTEQAVNDIKTAAELDPIVAGVEAIAKDVTATRKRVDEKVETLEKKQKEALTDIEGRMNKGFEDVLERMERANKAHSAAVRAALNIEAGRDSLQDVIGASVKEHSSYFDRAARQQPKELCISKPEIFMAAQEWFYHATRAQASRYAGRNAEHAERADQIRKAMADYYGVTKAAMQEDTVGEGGYLVPDIVEADIQRLVSDSGKLWPLCRQITMTSKNHKIPSEKTACSVGWIAEETELTGTNPSFAQTTIEAEKLYARATMSLELVQDSAPTLLPWLLRVFSEKMGRELDKQVVLGDGTTCELLGIVNGSGIVAETDTTQTHLTWGHVVRAFTGASQQSARDDGVFVCSPKGYKDLLSLADSAGNPIIQWGPAAVGAPTPYILGRPLVCSSVWGGAASLDDVTETKTMILFGPPSTFTAGTRIGMTWDVTDQVNWAKYQADARLVGRYGGRIIIPSAWTYIEVSY